MYPYQMGEYLNFSTADARLSRNNEERRKKTNPSETAGFIDSITNKT